MSKVIVAVVTPKGHFAQQWDYVVCNFEPDELYFIGGIFGKEEDIVESNVTKNAKYVETAEELPDLPLILLCPDNGLYEKGNINLQDFEHPKEAIYLFGSDSLNMSSDFLGDREPDYRVYIDTDTNDDMYSFVSYGVTMHDRRMKWQS